MVMASNYDFFVLPGMKVIHCPQLVRDRKACRITKERCFLPDLKFLEGACEKLDDARKKAEAVGVA